MINRHEYINDTLYLYFDYNYEFGSFNIKKSSKGYIDEVRKYIKKIKYKGSKIVIMIGSIVVVTLTLNNNSIELNKFEAESSNNINNVIEEKVEYTLDDIEDYTTLKPIEENISNINQNVEKEEIKKEESISKRETNKSETNNIIVETKESNKNIEKEEVKNENLIKLIHNDKEIEIELEDYVIGVVAAEMPASFNIEALKAQSVIARTYALNITSKGRTLTDNESTQSYIDIDQMKNKWGNEYEKYYTKIKSAVTSTKGITIKYNDEYIDCVYHSTSNGYTEDSINVWGNDIPYLKSVESTWDKNASTYLKDINIDINTFNTKLNTNISSIDEILIERNNNGRVSNVKIGDKYFTGINFRTILGLRSTDFDIELVDNNIKITTKGYGHGVGLSQYGANGMAKEGYTYTQILNHYYTNVVVK